MTSFLNIDMDDVLVDEDASGTTVGSDVAGYLLIKRVVIEGANAISSPLTYGFPAVTGFLGGFHAISRRLAEVEGLSGISLGGVLLACHDCTPRIYRENRYSDYTFNQTRNPIKRDGTTASIIEEGKCRLVMTFAVEVCADTALTETQTELLTQSISKYIWQHRMAGGSVQGLAYDKPVHFFSYDKVGELKQHLLPAFVLMEAQQEFADIIDEVKQESPEATELDALIDLCCLHHIPDTSLDDTGWQVVSRKSGRGWLVPIPIGYQGVSELYEPGVMQNTRSPERPSQYVETLYSLGKWVYPQRFGGVGDTYDIANAFWRHHYKPNNDLYLVTQNPNA